jgi:hypothetical protein
MAGWFRGVCGDMMDEGGGSNGLPVNETVIDVQSTSIVRVPRGWRRRVTERFLAAALLDGLPKDVEWKPMSRIMCSYMSDDDVDTWSPLELRDASQKPSRTLLNWRTFRRLHQDDAVDELQWDPRSGQVYFQYPHHIPVVALDLASAYFSAETENSCGTDIAYNDDDEAFQRTIWPRRADVRLEDCAILYPWERQWATRLWGAGPAAMMALYDFINTDAHRSYVDMRVTHGPGRLYALTKLALLTASERTRTGTCVMVDAALCHRGGPFATCLRVTHVCAWIAAILSALLVIVLGSYYRLCNVAATPPATPVVNAIFGQACVASTVLGTWCIAPVLLRPVRSVCKGARSNRCSSYFSAVVLAVLLVIVFAFGGNNIDEPLVTVAKASACVLVASACGALVMRKLVHDRLTM